MRSVLHRTLFRTVSKLYPRTSTASYRSFSSSSSSSSASSQLQHKPQSSPPFLPSRASSPYLKTTGTSFPAMSNFEKVNHFVSPYGQNVTTFRSNKTGLSVVHVDIDGPIVNGFFSLATEAMDDDGCPHTLEHLVFLGSEKYPYKGVLDSLANRALARGTNAWTDIDNTSYTITTAGAEGFLNLLPVFLDHILHPTMTVSGCHTEVHHINGKGENAGVVYCEMQGRQNTSGDLLTLRQHRILFPDSGYRSETGGLMENLRELSVQTIRDYHSKYYTPGNLAVIITGTVDHEKLLNKLATVEESILKKGPVRVIDRPWVTSKPSAPLKASTQEVVEFPDEDESMGEVRISWLGPHVNDHLEVEALSMLNDYLADSAISILHQRFIEIEEPLCTDVGFDVASRLQTISTVYFSGVPSEHLEEIKTNFFGILEEIVGKNDGKGIGIDMERMQAVLKRECLKVQNQIESDPHENLAMPTIVDFLYGPRNGQNNLEASLRDVEYLKTLMNYSEQQWIDLLKKSYLDTPSVTLIGRPSADLAHRLEQEEKARVEKQVETLGAEKLKKLEEELEKAQRENDVEMPAETIEDFPIPGTESIKFFDVRTARAIPTTAITETSVVQKHVDADAPVAPVRTYVEYSQINSAFVSLTAYLTTTNIPAHLRPYLYLFTESIFSLPLRRDGTEIPYEEVVNELNEDTVSYTTHVGGGGFTQLVSVNLKVEAAKYEKGVRWLKELLSGTKFNVERLKSISNKIFNSLAEQKRDGQRMASDVMSLVTYDDQAANAASASILKQEKFLPAVMEKLTSDPDAVIRDLEELRAILRKPENVRVHVAGDILALKKPKSAWTDFVDVDHPVELLPVPRAQDVLSKWGKSPGAKGYVIHHPSIESTYAFHSAKGPTSYDSPDYAKLLVLNELLSTMEGPFWKLIRGSGLAYGSGLRTDVEAGLVTFYVYRSPDAFKAFAAARRCIDTFASGGADAFGRSALDGARSGVLFSVVSRQSTYPEAAHQSFVNRTLRNVGERYDRDLLARLETVTEKDLIEMLEKYLKPLFEPASSNVVVVAAPGKSKEVLEGFKSLGFELESKGLDAVVA